MSLMPACRKATEVAARVAFTYSDMRRTRRALSRCAMEASSRCDAGGMSDVGREKSSRRASLPISPGATKPTPVMTGCAGLPADRADPCARDPAFESEGDAETLDLSAPGGSPVPQI